ncbi:related to CDC28-cyclin-dependent protein kinase [Sporisorium reilianum SRZ2]|uniref:Related to CDC28-cyclin-dependent protein kinase n=1 Tax=Sporisorium reilianum (strain SRZ2) TaxID=999809 RepID=E6ZLI4_SPORE|nr:related to CDC28-cyclin-dependent protein kinase [Sporisorium reilianum SRZ2]
MAEHAEHAEPAEHGADAATQLETVRSEAHPTIAASRSIYAYERLNHIQEGTYGVVFRARPRDPPSPSVVAVKKLKVARNGLDAHGFPITSLREIQTLTLARTHAHVVQLHEVCVGNTLDQIFLVMEFMEHDLKTLLTFKHKSRAGGFAASEVKTLMHQLLGAVAGLHAEWIVHRDLKSSNLLMDNRGTLKVADFGLARRFGDPVDAWVAKSQPRAQSESDTSSADTKKEGSEEQGGMTDLVVTLWYRAPELLLLNHVYRARESSSSKQPAPKSLRANHLFRLHSTSSPHPPQPLPQYTEKIDMWSVGCIFAELLTSHPLFAGTDEPDQLRRIDHVLGGPTTTNWPDLTRWMGLSHHHATAPSTEEEVEKEAQRRKAKLAAALPRTRLTRGALDLLFQLLQYDPAQRVSAAEALRHAYFAEAPRMAHPDSFGSFPSVAAGERVVGETPSAPNVRAAGKGNGEASKAYSMEFDFAG